jgi:hypothetical protein
MLTALLKEPAPSFLAKHVKQDDDDDSTERRRDEFLLSIVCTSYYRIHPFITLTRLEPWQKSTFQEFALTPLL